MPATEEPLAVPDAFPATVKKLLSPSCRYSYSFVQPTVDARINHSTADLELGYFITPSLRVIVPGNAQVSNGGIDVLPPELAVPVLTPEQHRHHDQS